VSDLSKGVVAVDNGGFNTTVVTKNHCVTFPSVKGEYRKRNLISKHGEFDFEVELEGKRYMAGTLAKHECQFPLEIHTDTKQHIFYDLSVLIACHQYGYDENYVILPVPIFMHNEQEKQGIINRLVRNWGISINGEYKEFAIRSVKVAPESVSAFWIHRPNGKSRWLDLGSRHVGFGTVINEGSGNGKTIRYVDIESGTFKKGMNTFDSDDMESFADFLGGRLKGKPHWNTEDKVFVHGGGSCYFLDLIRHLQRHFPNLEVVEDPVTANGRGLYELGKMLYGVS